MFLDIISKIFIFVAIHAMIIFTITYNSIFIIAECFAFFAYSKYILN